MLGFLTQYGLDEGSDFFQPYDTFGWRAQRHKQQTAKQQQAQQRKQ